MKRESYINTNAKDNAEFIPDRLFKIHYKQQLKYLAEYVYISYICLSYVLFALYL